MKLTPMLWIMGGNLAVLVLIDTLVSWDEATLSTLFSMAEANFCQIVLTIIVAIIASAVPPWRKYAGALWLSMGVLLLASIPACLTVPYLKHALLPG